MIVKLMSEDVLHEEKENEKPMPKQLPLIKLCKPKKILGPWHKTVTSLPLEPYLMHMSSEIEYVDAVGHTYYDASYYTCREDFPDLNIDKSIKNSILDNLNAKITANDYSQNNNQNDSSQTFELSQRTTINAKRCYSQMNSPLKSSNNNNMMVTYTTVDTTDNQPFNMETYRLKCQQNKQLALSSQRQALQSIQEKQFNRHNNTQYSQPYVQSSIAQKPNYYVPKHSLPTSGSSFNIPNVPYKIISNNSNLSERPTKYIKTVENYSNDFHYYNKPFNWTDVPKISLKSNKAKALCPTRMIIHAENEQGNTVCVRINDWACSGLVVFPETWSRELCVAQLNNFKNAKYMNRYGKEMECVPQCLQKLFKWREEEMINFFGFSPSDSDPTQPKRRLCYQVTIPNRDTYNALEDFAKKKPGMELHEFNLPQEDWFSIDVSSWRTNGWFSIKSQNDTQPGWQEPQVFLTHAQIEIECSYKSIMNYNSDDSIPAYTSAVFDAEACGPPDNSFPDGLNPLCPAILIHLSLSRFSVELQPHVIPLEHTDYDDKDGPFKTDSFLNAAWYNDPLSNLYKLQLYHHNIIEASSLDSALHYIHQALPPSISQITKPINFSKTRAYKYLSQFKPPSKDDKGWAFNPKVIKTLPSNISATFLKTENKRDFCFCYCPDSTEIRKLRIPTPYTDNSDGIFTICYPTEQQMLEGFRDMIVSIQPDELCGHNTSFDYRFLMDRVMLLCNQKIPYSINSHSETDDGNLKEADINKLTKSVTNKPTPAKKTAAADDLSIDTPMNTPLPFNGSKKNSGNKRIFDSSKARANRIHDHISNRLADISARKGKGKKQKSKKDKKQESVNVTIESLLNRQKDWKYNAYKDKLKSRFFYIGRFINRSHIIHVRQTYSTNQGAQIVSNWNMPHMIDSDTLRIFNNSPIYKFHKYTAKFLAKELLKDDKMDLPPAQIFENFRNRLYLEIAIYCKHDCDIVSGLQEFSKFQFNEFALSRLSHTSVPEALRRGASLKVTNVIFIVCKRDPRKFAIIPPKDMLKSGYKGAEGFSPKPMLLDEHFVLTNDFMSMYPTHLEEGGFCFSTCMLPIRIPGTENMWQSPFTNEELEIMYGPKEYPDVAKNDPFLQSAYDVVNPMTSALTYGLRPEENLPIVNFIRYDEQNNRGFRGVCPDIITGYKANRSRVKKEMEEMTKNPKYYYNDKWIDYTAKSKHISLNAYQLANKVLLNAIYGALGAMFGILVLTWISQCITSMARRTLGFTRDYTEYKFNVTDNDKFEKAKLQVLEERKIYGPLARSQLEYQRNKYLEDQKAKFKAKYNKVNTLIQNNNSLPTNTSTNNMYDGSDNEMEIDENELHNTNYEKEDHTDGNIADSSSIKDEIFVTNAFALMNGNHNKNENYSWKGNDNMSDSSEFHEHDLVKLSIWMEIESGQLFMGALVVKIIGKSKVEVIYGDTDSIFIHMKFKKVILDPETNKVAKECIIDHMKLGEFSANSVNDVFRSFNMKCTTLTFEKGYFPFMLVGGNKRYAGNKYEADKFKCSRDQKQLGMKRDSYQFIGQNIKKLFDMILDKLDKNSCLKYIEEYYEEMIKRCAQKNIPYMPNELLPFMKTKALRKLSYSNTASTKTSSKSRQYLSSSDTDTTDDEQMNNELNLYDCDEGTILTTTAEFDHVSEYYSNINSRNSCNRSYNASASTGGQSLSLIACKSHESNFNEVKTTLNNTNSWSIHEIGRSSSLIPASKNKSEPEHVQANQRYAEDFPGFQYNTGERVPIIMTYIHNNDNKGEKAQVMDHYNKLVERYNTDKNNIERSGNTSNLKLKDYGIRPLDIAYYIECSHTELSLVLQFCPGDYEKVYKKALQKARQVLSPYYNYNWNQIYNTSTDESSEEKHLSSSLSTKGLHHEEKDTTPVSILKNNYQQIDSTPKTPHKSSGMMQQWLKGGGNRNTNVMPTELPNIPQKVHIKCESMLNEKEKNTYNLFNNM